MDTYKVQANEMGYCDYLVQYISSNKAVEEKTEEALSLLRKNKIKGFRKGKAPDFAIKNLFKKQIEDYVSVKLCPEAYKDAIFETKYNPLGAPQFTKTSFEKGKFFCEFRLLTKPKIELKQYKEFELVDCFGQSDPNSLNEFNKENCRVVYIEQKIQESLKQLQVKHAELIPFEDNDVAELNDKLTLDIVVKDHQQFLPDNVLYFSEGIRESSKIESLCQEGFLYTLGQKLYPGFDEQLLGMKMGETKGFPLELENQIKSDLRGEEKVKLFEVTVQMGLKSQLHEVNDDLAKAEGLESLSNLKIALETKANQLLQQAQKLELQKQVVQKLLDNHNFKIPEWLIEQEANGMAQKQGGNYKDFMQQAENNLRISLLLEEIRKEEPEAGLSDMELIESLKRQVHENPKLQQWIMEAEKNGQLATWLANARVEYVLEWIMKSCKVV